MRVQVKGVSLVSIFSPKSVILQPQQIVRAFHFNSISLTFQIRRAIGSNNIPPPAAPAPVPTPSLPYQKPGMTQSQSTNFSKTSAENQTLPSGYGHGGIKTSASAYNFNTNPVGSYSTHPQAVRPERPVNATLPLHLQSKAKIGGPVGNVSLHSSNDSGFSNDPPPQPEIDYSDDESVSGQTKLPNR